MKLNRPIKIDIIRLVVTMVLLAITAGLCFIYYKAQADRYTGSISLRDSVVGAIDPKDKLALQEGEYRIDFSYSSETDRELTIENGVGEVLFYGIVSGETTGITVFHL